jgi:hypothetical protein
VLVLDTGRPANAVSNGVGGLLGQPSVAPADLRRAGREQLAEHPSVELRFGAERIAGGLEVELEDAAPVRTRSIVLAHGLRFDPPPLPGIEGLWGARPSTARSATAGRSAPHPNGPERLQRGVGVEPMNFRSAGSLIV